MATSTSEQKEQILPLPQHKKSFYYLGEARIRPQSNKDMEFRDAKFLPYYVSLHTLC